MKPGLRTKRVMISKAQSSMLIAVGVSTVVVVFCLVSALSLISQASYHSKELSAKRAALKQINANIEAANSLADQFKLFDGGNPNVIGGRNSTDQNAAPPDGNNARVVLNALPSKYDFPALISSLTNILNNNQITNPGISSTDQSASVDSLPTATPLPVAIPVSISGTASYTGLKNLVADFERSIRPYDVKTLQIKGSAASMSLSLDVTTYFQPPKTLSTATKEVR